MQAYYLVSTPLHLFVALGVALSRQSAETATLIFIDQYPGQSDVYIRCLKDHPLSPFKALVEFGGRDVVFKQKLTFRKQLFADLQAMIARDCPDRIYVGNDRRVEFQYLMQAGRKINPELEGVYLDEGMFTYVGRKASKSFSDAVVDTLLKKMAYGFWWSNPPTVGAGKWISQAYVAFADLVHPALTKKQLIPLEPTYFTHHHFQQLAACWLSQFHIDSGALAELDLMITLPEKTDMDKVSGYAEHIQRLVWDLKQDAGLIGIKYHPSERSEDPLNLKQNPSVKILPAKLPFEAMLPFLKSIKLLGDMSSTLLTTKLFRPDIAVAVMQIGPRTAHFEQFVGLFNRLELPILEKSAIEQYARR